MLPQFALSLAVAMLGAVAAYFGFGPGFVDDVIAYPLTAYVCAFAAFIARPGLAVEPFLRALIAAAVGALGLWALRTVALFTLPIGQFVTTGHSPFVALPICALLAEGTNQLLAWLRSARSGESVKEPTGA